ncbi:MAG: histidine phosphatase family protein [Candidatus Nanohaloarchaea archaeon]
MTRLFLARHGETDAEPGTSLLGRTGVELTDTGIEQARRLADRLAGEDVDAVYASPLERAMKTAEPVAAAHDLEPQPMSGLRAAGYGEAAVDPDGETRGDAVPAAELEPATGERLSDAVRRTMPVVDGVRERHPDGTVVLVGHGQVNRAVLVAALGTDSGRGHRIRQDSACLNVLEHEDYRGWRIDTVNDTSHL